MPDDNGGFESLAKRLGLKLGTALVQIHPGMISVTPAMGGYQVQVFATVAPESGQSIFSPPVCELFVADVMIRSQLMVPIFTPLFSLWVANLEMVNPYPQAAKVSATFVNAALFEFTTESDVAVIPPPPQTFAAADGEVQTASILGLNKKCKLKVSCIKNDNGTVTVTATVTDAAATLTGKPVASLYFHGETEPHKSGELTQDAADPLKYSYTFQVDAHFAKVKARFGAEHVVKTSNCAPCKGS